MSTEEPKWGITTLDWNWTAEQRALHSFTRNMISLRMDNPIFHRRRFFDGHTIHDSDIGDILWVSSSGKEMSEGEWGSTNTRALGMILNGEGMVEFDERGRRIKDDIFLVILNGWWEGVNFTLPGVKEFTIWEQIVDTNNSEFSQGLEVNAKEDFLLGPRSLSVFRLKARKANRTSEGKRRVTIVDQVRRLWDMIQE